jgi:UDP-N-acetylmuramate--alanine ligase
LQDKTISLAEKVSGSVYFPTFAEIEEYLQEEVRKGDIVIVMGAGDVTKISKDLIKSEKNS